MIIGTWCPFFLFIEFIGDSDAGNAELGSRVGSISPLERAIFMLHFRDLVTAGIYSEGGRDHARPPPSRMGALLARFVP
jgi:hypothetical protein